MEIVCKLEGDWGDMRCELCSRYRSYKSKDCPHKSECRDFSYCQEFIPILKYTKKKLEYIWQNHYQRWIEEFTRGMGILHFEDIKYNCRKCTRFSTKIECDIIGKIKTPIHCQHFKPQVEKFSKAELILIWRTHFSIFLKEIAKRKAGVVAQ